jgi:UDP-N-acetylglucosamine 2-epimerase (non-hydrolysing)
MRKVMTIVGTRPELIKMSRVIAAFDRHTEHVLVHTGQNFDYELNQVFFDDLEIRRPDYFLSVAGGNAAQAIARVIENADEVLGKVQPEALLLYGDTNSCLSVIAAKRRKIPVFHMEAGNRCFDQRVPEELNRKVLDHLSDVNLVLTEHARRYLLAEGIAPERVFKTGSHLPEVLAYYRGKITASGILSHLGLTAGHYFLVSAHREENVDDPVLLSELLKSLSALHQKYGYPVIVSTHPRTQKRLEALGLTSGDTAVRFLKPFGFFDYIHLQEHATCVLSDSGTITEEASLLGFPAITIRNAHERPEGMDEGTLIMSGLSAERVLDAVDVVISQVQLEGFRSRAVEDYLNPNVSAQVLRVVLSYVDYINRVIWSKAAS